ncbi:hypothetical protein [Actinomadura sp. DC4]|uniref:hypothetical protein n=1 Tax=Actinomadura sp. DC4 TaxID=3055069 RepID=UPI0025AFB592|nr:hypothetical protein [Actinomadura sp. DC4]MDN3353576.1 hypothetical protein [Actinomadura sp. DC4]
MALGEDPPDRRGRHGGLRRVESELRAGAPPPVTVPGPDVPVDAELVVLPGRVIAPYFRGR